MDVLGSSDTFERFSRSCTVHLDTIKSFIYQLMHNRVDLEEY